MRPSTRTSLFGLLAFALVLTLVLAPPAHAKRFVGNQNDNKLVGTGQRDDIFGRGGDDVLVGLAGPDYIYGEEGDDILLGESGKDRLWGGGRDDTLDGGLGSDRLWPGWGSDVVDAGPGKDVIWAGENDGTMDSIDCGPGFDRVIVNRGDRVFNCEAVTRLRGRRVPGITRPGTRENDVLSDWRWTGRDLIIGFAGNDYLNGHSNADLLWGNEGDDTLDGDLSPDLVLGGPGADLLFGDNGNDRLWGGFGLDTFYGGDGDDELISIEPDGVADVIDCGPGRDRVVARPSDQVAGNCERVIRIAR